MSFLKKHSLLILMAMLILLVIPMSFAADADGNATVQAADVSVDDVGINDVDEIQTGDELEYDDALQYSDDSDELKGNYAYETTPTVNGQSSVNYVKGTDCTVDVLVTGDYNWISSSESMYAWVNGENTNVNRVLINGIKANQGSFSFNLNFDALQNKLVDGENTITVHPRQTPVDELTYGDYNYNTLTVIVVGASSLTDPELTVPASLSVDVGSTANIGATQVGDGAISYASANTGVANVDANGVVTGVSAGSTIITVSVPATSTYSADSKDVTVTVNLLDPGLSVPDTLSVDVDDSVNIGATQSGDGAISYASADNSIATVEYNGVVTGVSAGTTTITVSVPATSTYGADSKEITVTVNDVDIDDVVYVDGFDGTGGSGTSTNPYHSLKSVLSSSDNEGKEIKLLAGTYDFTETINLYNREFTLTAVDEVIFTSSSKSLFQKTTASTLTFNGIKFKDITPTSYSAVLYSTSNYNAKGTLNFNNCSFINNRATNLIQSSCDINIKGCTFIDNEATGTGTSTGGLIQNYYDGTTEIDISYSIFINNKIDFTKNGFSPIIVDWDNDDGPDVYFNYNFVDNNTQLTQSEIVYNGVVNSYSGVIIAVTAPNAVHTEDTVDLAVNFTKVDGSALADSMPTLAVNLVATKNAATIPVTITNNGGKGQYTAKSGAPYTEIGDVKYDDSVLTTFTFPVTGTGLPEPELTVPESLEVEMGATANIGATREGDGAISYVSSDNSIATVDADGVVTGVAPGTATITVSVAETAEYSAQSKDVSVTVTKLNPNLSVPDTLDIMVGSSEEIGATSDSEGAISYVSSDNSIATVDADGVVTGVAFGTAVVTVTVASEGDYAADSKNVTVTVKKNPNLVAPESLTIKVGQGVWIDSPTVSASSGGTISYLSNDTSVATVTSQGRLSGVAAGTAKITVSVAATGDYGADSKDIIVTVVNPTSLYYVDSSINANGDGSEGSYYKTIEAAIAAANSNFGNNGGTIVIKEGTDGIYTVQSTMSITKNMVIKADENADVTIKSDFDGSVFSQNAKLNVNLTGLTFKDIQITSGAIFEQGSSTYDGVLNIYNCSFINNTVPTLVRLYKTNAAFKYDNFIGNTLTATGTEGGLINIESAGASEWSANNYKFDVSYSNIVDNDYDSYIITAYAYSEWSGAHQTITVNNNYWGSNDKPTDAYNAETYLTLDTWAILNVDVASEVDAGSESPVTLNFIQNDGETALGDYLPDLDVALYADGSFEPASATISKNVATSIYTAPATEEIDTISVNYGEFTLNAVDVTIIASESIETSIAAADLVMNYMDGTAWAVTLTDADGNAISDAVVKVGFNANGVGKVYNLITDANGVVSLPINVAPGEYGVNATFDGDDIYAGSFAQATVTVNPAVTVLTGDDIEISYKNGAWTVTLTDANGNAISSAAVKIGFNANGVGKVYSRTTDANGAASLPINVAPGEYAVNATFAGSKKYAAAFVEATVTVVKAQLTVSAEDLTMGYKDGSSFKVNVTDSNGNAMANINVKFTIGTKSYNFKTDSNGVAKLPINLPLGEFSISASVNEAGYGSNEITNTITVTTSNLAIVADDVNMTYKDGTAYEVQLVNGEGNPVALANQVVKITISGKSYNMKTNANGIASLPINLKAGNYVITAEYNGIEISNNITVVNA